MMRRTEFASPNMRGRRDVWLICDGLADFARAPNKFASKPLHAADWQGAPSYETARDWALKGRPELVAPSEAIMAKLESELEPLTSARRRVIHDVCGSAPNVAAYLSGSPLAMRRRAVEQNDVAPIGIIADIGTSSGLSDETIQARGACILALVRLLSARRAVELWLCDGGEYQRRDAGFVTFKLDTNPLALAHAAYVLTHPSASRVIAFGLEAAAGFHDGVNVRWPYSGAALSPVQFEASARLALPHLPEMIALPGAHMKDKLIREPLAWLAEKLAQYGACND